MDIRPTSILIIHQVVIFLVPAQLQSNNQEYTHTMEEVQPILAAQIS